MGLFSGGLFRRGRVAPQPSRGYDRSDSLPRSNFARANSGSEQQLRAGRLGREKQKGGGKRTHLPHHHAVEAKKKKSLIVQKFEALMEMLLSKFEVFKRKHPKMFKAVIFLVMIVEEGLYVYDLYTDVVVVIFFFDNGLLAAMILSIVFITWHYVLLAAFLTFFIRRWLMSLLRPAENELMEVESLDEQRAALVAAHKGAQQGAKKKKRKNMLLYFWHTMSNSPIVAWLLAPWVFLASFIVTCVIVPIIDVFMLVFDLVAYVFAPKAEDEDSNPLNNRFINFLLQYRTLRLPMEVIMESFPQAILSLVMWQYLKRNPPVSTQGPGAAEFSDFAVIQAFVASLANLAVNGITLYLSTKVSGRTWLRYMVMAVKFEGSAKLPPEWDDRTTAAATTIDGNYHRLKLAQQMKILQTVVRRDTITLRTPFVDMSEKGAAWLKPGGLTHGDVVLENRKMLEFLYEWDGGMKRRRLPSKVDDLAEARDVVHVNVALHRVDELPAKAPDDAGNDMDISYEQLKANIAEAPTETVAMWLISHRQIVASLVNVALTRCNLDASYMLPERISMDPSTGESTLMPGPLASLLRSKQMKRLDLSNNPLFLLLRPDPNVRDDVLEDEPKGHASHAVSFRAAPRGGGGAAGAGAGANAAAANDAPPAVGEQRGGGDGLGRFNVLDGAAHAIAAMPILGHGGDSVYGDGDSELYDYEWDLDSAIEIFSKELRENSGLEELRLSCTSMHPDATLAVFSALATNVDDMSVRANDTLKSLDVSHNYLLKLLPTPDGTPHPETAVAALRQQVEELAVCMHQLVALRSLNISATFLTIEQMTTMMLGIPSAVDVNRVHDDTFLLKPNTNKVSRDHGVSDNTTLTELDLSHIAMGDKGLEEVIHDLLKSNKKLRTLYLRAIGRCSVGMKALAEVLQTNQHLQVLDLSNNSGIKDAGAKQLAHAMTHNNRHSGDGFLSLNMSGTALTARGIEDLCKGLCAMSSLVAVDLSNSHWDAGPSTRKPVEWTLAAAQAIGGVLKANPGLRYLSLSRCHLSTAGARALAYEFGLDNATYDTERSCLETLDLSYNPLGEDGVRNLVAALQMHKQLKGVSLAATNLTTVGLSEVLHQFMYNKCLEELDLRHNFIKSVNPRAFAAFNANNTTVRCIDLRWNRIEESECAALSKLFTVEEKTAALATMGEAKSLRQQIRDLLDLDETEEEAPYVLLV